MFLFQFLLFLAIIPKPSKSLLTTPNDWFEEDDEASGQSSSDLDPSIVPILLRQLAEKRISTPSTQAQPKQAQPTPAFTLQDLDGYLEASK